jgi:hypothetical protein
MLDASSVTDLVARPEGITAVVEHLPPGTRTTVGDDR